MQRMLVGLVVFLTVAVGALGIAFLNLHSKVNEQPSRSAAAGARGVVEKDADAARISTLEMRLANLRSEVERLRKRKPASPPRIESPNAAASPGAEQPAGLEPENAPRQRDAEGNFVISEEDEVYFVAVQKRVQYKQRIDGQTRNAMRRVDRLATRGEIGALAEQTRSDVGRIIRRFVVAADDTLGRYVRNPSEEIRSLSREQRTQKFRADREELVAQAQTALEPVLGVEDAGQVAQIAVTFNKKWGYLLKQGADGGSRKRRK